MLTCSCKLTYPIFENIFRGMAFEKRSKTIFNNLCELKPIGKVKHGKIFWFKN